MIAPNALEITTETQKLMLAPFGAEHLRDVLPLPSSLTSYLPAANHDLYLNSDPNALYDSEQAVTQGLTWGIFNASKEHELTPGRLLGAIALYHDVQGSKPCTIVREVATLLFREEFVCRGIGTLAKLAIAKHAFLTQSTRLLYAQTSTNNTRAKRSLSKAGFSYLSTSTGEIELIEDKTPLETWLLAHESAIGNRHSGQLSEGWQRFTQASRTIAVKEIS